jgi:hypothetical protein
VPPATVQERAASINLMRDIVVADGKETSGK